MKKGFGMFFVLLMTMMMCSLTANAEPWFGDINIISSYGGVNDYYYLGEEFTVTTELNTDLIDISEIDTIIALHDTDGIMVGAKIADKTALTGSMVAEAKFTVSDSKELSVKCYAWQNGTMVPLVKECRYYINGKEKLGDVCIPYNAVEEITATKISGYTGTPAVINSYQLASGGVYINGKLYNDGINILKSYYENSSTSSALSDIILTDSNKDGLYEKIEAQIGVTAVVSSIIANTIYFTEVFADEAIAAMRVDDGAEYIFIYEDEEIRASELKSGDVLTIYYDVEGDYASSSFYKVYVSRKKVSGVVTSANVRSVTLDNTKYLISPVTKNNQVEAYLGYNFEYLLDASNKVVYGNESATSYNKTVEFTTDDFANYETWLGETSVMEVYKSPITTATYKYEIRYGADFYVNGVKISGGITYGNVEAYIANNTLGRVTLVDIPEVGSSTVDGIYDYVMVSYYKDAVVDSVVGDEEQATIYFSEIEAGLEATMYVDYTDDEYSYKFTLTDGTELTALDLQENDVLSIAYDPINGFVNSKTYNVLVSRDTIEGKIARADIDTANPINCEFTVNGKAYKLASLDLVKYTDLKVSYEYALYLDAFGRIAKCEETATSNKLAILENVYKANGDQYYATLILPDGTKETYTIKDAATAGNYVKYCYGSSATIDANGGVKLPIQNRVWAYSVSSTSGNITLKGENGGATAYTPQGGTTAAYKASSSKIGSIRINETLTSIIDATEGYNANGTIDSTETMDVGAISMDLLEDDADYVAYGFNKLSDNSYQLVIITDGTLGSVTYKTPFVVYSRSYTTEVDGEDKTAYLVYTPGGTEAQEIILDDSSVAVANIVEGTPIIVKRNLAGYATSIAPLFVANALGDYNTFATAVRANMLDGTWSDILNVSALDANLKKTNQGGASDWVFGMVYDRSSSSLTIASTTDTYRTRTVTNKDNITSTYNVVTNVDNLKEYDVDADAGVITYSYENRAGKGVRVANSILSTVPRMNMSTAFVDANDVEFAWDHASIIYNESATYGRTTFVLAKTIDGDIVEAYVIIPSSSR